MIMNIQYFLLYVLPVILMLDQASSQSAQGTIQVRLVNGSSRYEGTVQYSEDGTNWHTTCGVNLDISAVRVICRQLGFTGANRNIPNSLFGSGNDLPATSFNCAGSEPNLGHCIMNSDCPSSDSQPAAGAAVCYDERYLGCFNDNRTALPGNELKSDGQTIEVCIEFCKRTPIYVYAGVTHGSECYCGDSSADYGRYRKVEDDGCQIPCTGDQHSSCGGIGKTAIFKISLPLPSETSVQVTITTPQNGMLTRNTETTQPANNCSCLCEVQQTANTAEVAIAFGVLFGVSVIYGIFVSVGLYLTRRALLTLKKSRNSKEQDDQYQAIDRGANKKPSLYQDLKPTEEKELSGKDHTYESHIVVDDGRDVDSAYELNNF